MSKKDDIRKIRTECFDENSQFVDMYFKQVYNDDDALLLTDASDTPVSSLMLQHHAMSFHGLETSAGYIEGAATRRSKRGMGYMTQLMRAALEKSASDGDMMCTLIPATQSLYFYYNRYGFSTVFFTKEQRFTAFHSFTVEGEYFPIDNPHSDAVWEAFDRFQRERKCYVLHNRHDFDNILLDLKIDNGTYVVMASKDEETGKDKIVSMAWGLMRGDLLTVLDIMGESKDARNAALRQLRGYYNDTPVFVYGHPEQSGGRLMPRAMGRLVNVGKALSIVAESHPSFKCKLKVKDDLLSELNSHIFILANGECKIDDSFTGHLDFDVDIDVMADILFSCEKIGNILNFPTIRPMISLMLD